MEHALRLNPIASPSGSRATLACIHCAREFPGTPGDRFCCPGCASVFALLQERGLGRYYELRDRAPGVRDALPAPEAGESFAYLDDPEFRAGYAADGRTMRFYLEGVHCAACIWLTEKLPELAVDAESARLDLASAVATVRIRANGSFAAVAHELQRLGYRPHPVREAEADPMRDRETRRDLYRLGVAAAGAGNIMLLAAALYAGADGEFARSFRWVSLVLYLPVLVYSGGPFFRSALGSVRARRISIDIPVALGIAMGTLASLINVARGSNELYFDSLAGLIFLLLATRYALKRVQARALNASHLLRFLAPSRAHRRAGDAWEDVHVDTLRAGDQIRVLPGEPIPVDGIVRAGTGHVSSAMLTGEARSVRVVAGHFVAAGSRNVDSWLEIEVRAAGGETRLAGILAEVERELARKAPVVALADRVGQVFVAITVALVGLGFLLGLPHGLGEALSRAFAVAIVVCPCAFALAVPLAMSVSLGRLARAGLLVRGADTLEKLSQVREAFLDKTGTLTRGRFELHEARVVAPNLTESELRRAAAALEADSRHPMAQAIRRAAPFGGRELPEVTGFCEISGYGVAGRIDGVLWEVVRPPTGLTPPRACRSDETAVVVMREGSLAGWLYLGDEVLPDAARSIAELRRMGVAVRVLSGDRRDAVVNVAERLGIPACDAISEATPERKAAVLRGAPGALMVGDGANDTVAFASAYVSVAVHGGMEISLRAADAYSGQPGVAPVVRLLTVARETMRVIRRSLLFSFVYNCVGVGFALSGHLSPLVAAVLMPLSASSVFLLAVRGTRRQRAALRTPPATARREGVPA